jgi:EthD domain
MTTKRLVVDQGISSIGVDTREWHRMIKIFGYLKTQARPFPAGVRRLLRTQPRSVGAEQAAVPLVYKRNYIQRGDTFNIEGDEIGFDCMTELVFAERDDLLAWMTSLGDDEIARDEQNFIDGAATRAYVVDERTSAG